MPIPLAAKIALCIDAAALVFWAVILVQWLRRRVRQKDRAFRQEMQQKANTLKVQMLQPDNKEDE